MMTKQLFWEWENMLTKQLFFKEKTFGIVKLKYKVGKSQKHLVKWK